MANFKKNFNKTISTNIIRENTIFIFKSKYIIQVTDKMAIPILGSLYSLIH